MYDKIYNAIKKAVDSGVASGVNFLALKNGREIISCQYGYRDIENQKPMTTKEFSELIAENDLCFDPGEHFMYGVSADILGALIERTTDMKLGEFMQKELFEPLEMNDTGFYVPAEKADRTAKVYDFIDGHLSKVKTNHLGIKYTLDIPPAFESGGAGICSTLDDYSKFAEMLLENGNFRGRQIIPEKAVKYMISGGLTDIQKADLQAGWGDLYGYTYGNMLRVCEDESKAVVLSVNAPDLQKLNSVFLHGFDLPSKVGSGFVCESYKSKSHGNISKLFY